MLLMVGTAQACGEEQRDLVEGLGSSLSQRSAASWDVHSRATRPPGISVTRGCYLCSGANLKRLPLQTGFVLALISPADRQLVTVQYKT